jgi:hypothetical protein
MAGLLGRRASGAVRRRSLALQTGDEFAEERTTLEVPAETRVRRRNPVERQHLLDGVGVAEQHHDFLQVRAGHCNPRRGAHRMVDAWLSTEDSKTAANVWPRHLSMQPVVDEGLN